MGKERLFFGDKFKPNQRFLINRWRKRLKSLQRFCLKMVEAVGVEPHEAFHLFASGCTSRSLCAPYNLSRLGGNGLSIGGELRLTSRSSLLPLGYED